MAGQLWTWGSNANGTLGDNTSTNKSSPVQTIALGNDWKQISKLLYNTAAIKTDGTLWTWGSNTYGQLGDNSTTNRSSPVQTIVSGADWSIVSVYMETAAAIKNDGTLWTWGRNLFGSLGDNNTTNKSSPVQTIARGNNWLSVSAGLFSMSATKKDGTLWVWGSNSYGQIGDNTTVDKSSPVQTITGGNNWKQVSTGERHVAAIKNDGTLWLWGSNSYGELGDNTNTSKSSPVQTTAGGNNWSKVVTAYYLTAAIKTDGTLWAWGRNTYGELGDNTTIRRSSPVQTIAGGNNWVNISAGYGGLAATKTDGTLWSWGLNNQGQIGDNTTVRKSSPVQTIAFGTRWASPSFSAAFYENDPSALTVTTQPAYAYDNNKILIQPQITAVDASGNPTSVYYGIVTAAVVSGTATLTGTTNIQADSGIATFTDLVLEGTGEATLQFTASGLTSALASGVNIEISNIAIVPKRTETSGRIPDYTQLRVGELAINIADKKGYVRKSDNSVVNVFTGLGAGVITSGMLGENSVTMNSIAPGAVGPSELASGVIGGNNSQVLYNSSGSITSTPAFTVSTTSGVVTIAPQNAGYNALTLRSYTSQSADLLKVQNSAGVDIAGITSSGVFYGLLSSGMVVSGNVASGQIGLYHLASGVISTAVLGSGQVTSGNIASGQIGQFHLSSGAVNSGHIGNNAVVSGSIASGQIFTLHIASGGLLSGAIGSGQIGQFHLASGVLSTAILGSGQVTSGNIASGSIGQFHLSSGAVNSGQIGNNAVVSGSIASGSIGQFHLSSGAVNSGHIGNNAVVSGSIASGQIGQFHIASGVITANHIASGAIVSADIADNAIISGKIASGVVAWFNLASGAVRSGHIGDNAVVSGSIASGQIGLYHIASGVLSTAILGSGQVVSGNIGNNAVVSGSIASGQIGQFHIASGVITANHIASGAIISADIADNAVVSGKIASGVIGSFNLSSGTVLSGHIGNNAVVSGSIASGQIGLYHIASGVLSTAILGSGQVVSGNIGNNAVVSGSIASGQIGQFHIASGVINSQHIASGTISSEDIADNAIVSGKIASGVVAWFNLASGAVRSGHIGDNAVVSGSIASGQIGSNHLASGTLFSITNPADNRILTSLASGTNQANAETNLTYDGTTLDINSTSSGSVVFNIDGNSQQIMTVSDLVVGNILEVGSISGNPIFFINSSGTTNLSTYYGEVYTNRIFSIPTLSGSVTVQEWKNASGTTMASVNTSGVFVGFLASGIVVSGTIADNAIISGKIASGVVAWFNLASGAVRSGHIGDNAVVSGSIASGQIGLYHIASGVLSTAILGSGQVVSGNIGNNAVTSGNIASGQIGRFHLSSGTVNSGHIGDNAVVSGSIASGQVGQFHIASGAITANHIASGAIITADIADNAVVSGKIASGVVAWFNLSSGTVRSGHIGDGAVVSGSIASGQISTFHIASGGLLSGAIGSGQIGFFHLASGVISTATLGSGQVTSGNIASGQIGQFHLSSGAVNSGHIGNNAVVSGSIASGSITINHLGTNVATTTNVASGLVQRDANNYIYATRAVIDTIDDASAGGVGILGTFYPVGDLSRDLGTAGARWRSLFFGSGQANNILIDNFAASGVALVVKSASGQFNNLTEWQTASGTIFARINASGEFFGLLSSGIVTSGAVASGQIGRFHLSSGTVNSGHIGNNAVVSGSIASGQIGLFHLASGTIAPAGTQGQVQYNASGAFAGASGLVYAASGTNVLITAQNANNTALVVQGASGQFADVLQIKNSSGLIPFAFGLSGQPKMTFTNTQNVPITLKLLDDAYGTMSFEGSAGQLFSIANILSSGIIFSVNDISGIPSLDVNADGTVRVAPFGGNVLVGTTVATSGKLQVNTGVLSGKGIVVQAVSGQTANYIEFQNYSGIPYAYVNASGTFFGLLASGIVTSGTIASGSIGQFHLSSGIVNSGHIGNNAVVSGSIASGQIGQFHLSSGAVNSGQIGNNAVVSGSIASGQVSIFHLASGVLSTAILGSGQVTSGNIASGSIGQFHLSSGAVNSGHIGNNAVVSGSIASGQIGQFHIASGVITANHIASGAIISADIADNAIISGKIASGVIASFNLSSGTVLSGHIGNNAVVSGSIASGQIFTFHIVNGGLLSGAIGSGQIGQAHLASGAVISGDIGNAAVVSGSIASGAIGQMHLSSGAINSGQIGNNAVVSGSIASGQICNFHLASGAAGVAGSSGQFQFNNGGVLGGSAGLTYSITSGTPNLTAQSQTAWNKTIIIKAISGQVVNLTEWQNNSGAILSTVNLSGALGIGTGSNLPTAFFEVNQSANKAVRIGDVAGSFDNSTYNPDITTLGAVISLQTGADTTYRQSLYGYQDASANAKLALFSRSDIVFLTFKTGADSRQMVIKETTGNVGINTMTPSGKFHVTTTTASDKVAIFQGYTSQTGNIVEVQNSAGNPFVIATPSGTLNVMQAGGTLGFDEIRISHDGTKGTIRSIDGDLQLGGGNSSVNIRNSGNTANGNLNASTVYTVGVNSADTVNTEGRTTDSYQWAIDNNSFNWNRSFNIRVGWSHIKGAGHAGGLRHDGDGTGSGSYACLIVTNGLSSGGTLAYYSSTTTISASTNNFQPTTYSAFQRLSPTANWDLTGMHAYPSSVTSGGGYPGWVHVNGRVMWLHNVSSTYSITLKHQQTSDALNQFFTETQGDMVLGPGKMVQLTYDATIGKWRVNGSQYPYNWPTTGVTSGYIFSTNASGTVSLIQSHLFSGAINSGQIGNNAVTSGNIASGQICQFHIASGVLTTISLGSGQIVSGNIGNGAVVSGSIASGQIGQMHLSSGAVNSGQIGNNAVVSGSIASGQVGQFHIASGAITANHIASGAIITADIADNAVVSGKIASGVIASFNLSSGAVLSGHIGNAAVVSGSIASGSIGAVHLASGSLFSVTNPADNRILTSLASGTNQANAETNLTYDGTTLDINSASSGSTVFNIDGTSQQIMTVSDLTVGNILEVGNISGNPIFAVNSTGYTANLGNIFSGQTATFTAFSLPKTSGTSATFDYYVLNTLNSGCRAGVVYTVWDSVANTTAYNENQTSDLNGSTSGLTFTTSITSGNLVLNTNIAVGTWNVKLGAKVL